MVSLSEGIMSNASSGLPQKSPQLRAGDVLFLIMQLRARHVLFLTLVVVGFAYLAAPELWDPWVYFTGGSFHAVPWWSGAGSFTAPDGTYRLYLSLSPVNTGSHPTL